ncbi:MAG: glutamyl-tRNA amidotransferase [Chloroflexi bacterium]|nr:glutamyl-tRNA amidotransferase [Chloroflexota bacterium]|tara:strand:- start:1269 stop:1712 length:444 start_codon:yes stop_codon:yes gene_type:complete
MLLNQKLRDDLKQSMLSGDDLRRSVIRLLLSAIKNEEIRLGKVLDDEGIVSVLSRQAKQRRESIQAYTKAERNDLIEQENGELKIILEYLPTQMSAEELTDIISKVIEESGAKDISDIGRVMGPVMKLVKSRASGADVREIVNKLLN